MNQEKLQTMIQASIERASCSDSIEKISDSDDSSACLLEITIKRVGSEGSVLTLQVPSCASVFDLKTLISEGLASKNEDLPVERQRLIFSGRMLTDNDEVLGDNGVNMKTNAINFVHLSPLPVGAKPSKRASSKRPTRAPVEVQLEGSPASMQRARRLGALSRERRRRRREEPYSTDSVVRSGESRATSAEPQQPPTRASDPHPQVTLSGTSDHAHHPAIATQISDILLGRGAAPLLNSLLPSVGTLYPLAQQVNQVSAAVASSREAQQGLTLALRSALIDRIRHASMEIIPTLAHLQGHLHRINESHGLDAMEETEISDMLSSLDRVAQESGSLAVALRSMQRPPAISVLAPPPSQLILEQWLMDSMGNRTTVVPGGGSLLMPGSWLTHML